jgi:ribonuclease Z
MLMRLNLDKVPHKIHCYYPARGQLYFDRLRYGTIYHQMIQIVEHPIAEEGVIEVGEDFQIEARFLDHGVDNLGWRITERDTRKFDRAKLQALGVEGSNVRLLEKAGELLLCGKRVTLDEVSHIRQGESVTVVIDTLPCQAAIDLARGARLLLCESTYLEEHRQLALEHHHMTARQAAEIALKAGAQQLILTHFSARYRETAPFEQEARSVFPHTSAAEDLKVFMF